jgi:hypothetical protein
MWITGLVVFSMCCFIAIKSISALEGGNSIKHDKNIFGVFPFFRSTNTNTVSLR